MASQSLYRRILGPRFDALPGVLKKFHDSAVGCRARGILQVERGDGLFCNTFASHLGLPRAGNDVPVRLEVRVEGDRERWIRRFPDRNLVSTQWAAGALLMESVGLTSFASALVIDRSTLHYEFRRAWFAGIPLPTGLSPSVNGRVEANDTGWRVVVDVFAPFLGHIVKYHGRIEPE
jgi:hypothetical protein